MPHAGRIDVTIGVLVALLVATSISLGSSTASATHTCGVPESACNGGMTCTYACPTSCTPDSATKWATASPVKISPVDESDVDSVIPLGDTNADETQIRPKHKTFITLGLPACKQSPCPAWTDNVPIYAMGDGIVGKVQRDANNNYSVVIRHTCNVTVEYQGIKTLDPALVTALECQTNCAWPPPFPIPATGDWDTASAMLPILAGAAIGTVQRGTLTDVYRGTKVPVVVMDARKVKHTYVNAWQSRYPEGPGVVTDNAHSNGVPFVDYMTTAIRDTWTAKLPDGGRIGWDMPGRLQGSWFDPTLSAIGEVYWELGALSFVPTAGNNATYDVIWGKRKGGTNASDVFARLDPAGWPTGCTGTDVECAAAGKAHPLYPTSNYPASKFDFTLSPLAPPSTTVNVPPVEVKGDAVNGPPTRCYEIGGNTGSETLVVYGPSTTPAAVNLDAEKIQVKYYPIQASSGAGRCATLLGTVLPAKVDGAGADANGWKTFVRNRPSTVAVLKPPVDISDVSYIIPPGFVDPNSWNVRPARGHQIVFSTCAACSRPVYAPVPNTESVKLLLVTAEKRSASDAQYTLYVGYSIAGIGSQPPSTIVVMFRGLTSLSTAITSSTGWNDREWLKMANESITHSWADVSSATTGTFVLPVAPASSPRATTTYPNGVPVPTITGGVEVGRVKETIGSNSGFVLEMIVSDTRLVDGVYENASTLRYPRLADELDAYIAFKGFGSSSFGTFGYQQYGFWNEGLNAQCVEKYFTSNTAPPGDKELWEAKHLKDDGVNPTRCAVGGADRPATLSGVWFNEAIETDGVYRFGNFLGGLSIINSPLGSETARSLDIGWGWRASASMEISPALPSAILNRAAIDPMSWTLCGAGIPFNTCLADGLRPTTYDPNSAQSYYRATWTAAHATMNPDPSTVTTGNSVCYDLRRPLPGAPEPPYHYVFFHLESANKLRVKYMPVAAEAAACTTPPTVDSTWKTYVR